MPTAADPSIRLWLRCDAGASIGIGHAMRCLALAQAALEMGFRPRFIGRFNSEFVARLAAEEIGVELLDDEREFVDRIESGEIAVIDGYHLDPCIAGACRARGAVVVVIDDIGAAVGECDLVLNQNLTASTFDYGARQVLRGPRFALLRREVLRQRERLARAGADAVVVSTGGGRADLACDVAAGLRRMLPESVVVRAVVGVAVDLEFPAGVIGVIGARDMGEELAAATLYVGAAGSTAWELACLGVPAVLAPIAQNQQANAIRLEAEGVAVVVDPRADALVEAAVALYDDGDRRAAMARRGPELVDGNGARRVIEVVTALRHDRTREIQ